MSDNEYERFEINDYDLQNEFNNGQRRGRRPTKNQQIYGVFADDDSGDDGPGMPQMSARRRGGGGGGKKTTDYTAHVPFVAGGIQQSGKPKPGETKANDAAAAADEPAEDEDVDGRPLMQTSSESESDAEPAAAARGFGLGHTAGMRRTHSVGTGSVAGAQWDQHTKGIGAKLLLKMGYQPGKGLGKDLQGIAQPVQAHLRKGRGAIGAYGTEPRQTIGDGTHKDGRPTTTAKIDDDQRERDEFQQQMHQWRKSDAKSTATAKRYAYKSAADVIERGNARRPGKRSTYVFSERASAQMSNVTVIDMTGPEKRVLSGYHALGQQRTAAGDEVLYEHRPTKRCDNFQLPELMHNMQLMVQLCEQEIIAIDREQRANGDRRRALLDEREQLAEITALERTHIDRLEGALELVDRLVDSGAELRLEEAAELFERLQRDWQEEFDEFGLLDLAPGIVAPLISMALADWRPLEQPAYPIALLLPWRRILRTGDEDDDAEAKTPANGGTTGEANAGVGEQQQFRPYSAVLWASVIPHIRRTIAEDWDARAHAQMARLLDAWSSVLPAWQLDQVLEKMLLPRIARAVRDWDPLTDTVPVHEWIVPWRPLLPGARLDELVYAPIREKLANALLGWQPVDRSARAMLEPWLGVWPEHAMSAFLGRCVVPKLQHALVGLVINPMEQQLELFNQVVEWQTVLPVEQMAGILERYFFPKWLQTLVIWLNQAPNLEHVSRWYSGWKAQLSAAVLEHAVVRDHFNRALALMQRSLASEADAGAAPMFAPAAPPSVQPTRSMQQQQQQPMVAEMTLEFRDVVSQKCAERGIVFVPMVGRREQGKQVYRVGAKLMCYLDRTVIMLSHHGEAHSASVVWQPTALHAMLEVAQNYAR